ncbi:MAG: phage portal protein [Pseudomonadota bacterium]
MTVPQIIDQHGNPVSSGARMVREPYEGASRVQRDLAGWIPYKTSGQAALNFDRDLLTSRIQDMARNDGWASAGMDRLVDTVIGGGWRLSSKPNWRALGIDPEAAFELSSSIEAEWRDYVNHPGRYCDVTRERVMGGQQALAFRHRCLDGEALAVIYYLPRGGDYGTSVNIIDPDRLSTPMAQLDSTRMRAGVELDRHGAAVAYHIRKQHPADDILVGADFNKWERVLRETRTGRPRCVHAFEAKRAGQRRGEPVFTPILRKLRQVSKYDQFELQAAALNAVLAAFVTTPFDQEGLMESLSGSGDSDLVKKYHQQQLAFHQQNPFVMDGAQINFMHAGEKVDLSKPAHPNAVFDAFMRVALRNIASALGLSYEQLTMDWSQVNYSSARAALLEVWRGLTARKTNFAATFMQPIFMAWLEEAIAIGRVALPTGAPPFREYRAAYCTADWIGPGRGWVDPQKEADAAVTRIDAGLSTLERECAEQGLDWVDVAEQRARERDKLKELGLEPDAPLRPTQTRDRPMPDDQVAA